MQQLSAYDLIKTFGVSRALDRVSFTASRAEFIALLGENGAGKSTLLASLAGALRPDSGEIRIDGAPLHAQLPRIGAVLHRSLLYSTLTGLENLQLFAVMYGISDPAARVREVSSQLQLGDELRKQVRHCSAGMAKRLSIARALLNDPPLLLLDEPFASLDTVTRDRLLDVLVGLHRNGRTILLSLHEPERLAGIATRALVLSRGKVAADSRDAPFSASALQQLLGAHTREARVI